MHVVARHLIDASGVVETTLLASPSGVRPDHALRGSVEFLAEQGDALIYRTDMQDGVGVVTIMLTLQSSATGELFATDGRDWSRASVAVEHLPAIAHEH